MIEWFTKVFTHEDDPVYRCDIYITDGCSHVDGMLCNMKTCNILKDYKELEQ